MLDWQAELRAEGLTEATVRTTCRYAKGILADAVRRGLIDSNPAESLKSSALAANRDRYVTPAEAAALIEAAPSAAWRVLFGLCRFAGLRRPSETHGLLWEQVDWQRSVLHVDAPKTDRTRTVPIAAELLPLLRDAQELAEPGAERVVGLSRNNLHRTAEVLARRAGVDPWPRFFRPCDRPRKPTSRSTTSSTW